MLLTIDDSLTVTSTRHIMTPLTYLLLSTIHKVEVNINTLHEVPVGGSIIL